MPIHHPTDEELLRQMRAGDEAALVALYRRRQAGIYKFALRMSGSEAIAEDVTQEVFLILMRGDGHFDPARGSVAAYLYGVARNQVLRRFEKERVWLPIDEDDEEGAAQLPDGLIALTNPLGDLTRAETIGAVRQAVLALPAHYREVVVLCDLHELSYVETAAALGCAVGTVRSRLHRARSLLLEKLKDSEVVRRDAALRCYV